MTHSSPTQSAPSAAQEDSVPDNMGIKSGVLSNLAGAGVLLILVTVVIDVAIRQFTGAGILGADTIVSDWWMVAVAMLGIVAAERSGTQIVVDILGAQVSPAAARRITMFAGAVVVIFSAVVAVVSGLEALEQMRLGEYAAVGSLPIWPARFLIPLGFGGLAVFAAASVLHAARGTKGQAS